MVAYDTNAPESQVLQGWLMHDNFVMRGMLGSGLSLGPHGICFSSECADADIELMVGRNRPEMYSLLQRINTYLMRWARKKYKRLRTWKRFKAWWRGLTEREPELFAHWVWMRVYRWTG